MGRLIDPDVPHFEFTWEDPKYAANLRKHGVDFKDVPQMFLSQTVTELDRRYDYPEERYITTGRLKDGRVLVVAHTEEDNHVHLISARRALPHEETAHYRNLRR